MPTQRDLDLIRASAAGVLGLPAGGVHIADGEPLGTGVPAPGQPQGGAGMMSPWALWAGIAF